MELFRSTHSFFEAILEITQIFAIRVLTRIGLDNSSGKMYLFKRSLRYAALFANGLLFIVKRKRVYYSVVINFFFKRSYNRMLYETTAYTSDMEEVSA